MSNCNGCGGVIGRDCYNPQECQEITSQMIQNIHQGDAHNDGYQAATSHYQPLLDAKDAEIAALKALLEQAREALDVARKEVNAWHSGINTKAGLRNLHKAKVGACFGSSGLISHVLAAINATIGKK